MSGEIIVIDPVGMNIVNRVAPGTVLEGDSTWIGGLLVQGSIKGNIKISGGPLVLDDGAVIAGKVQCVGDVYLFGKIDQAAAGQFSEVVCTGAAFLAETLVAEADISAAGFKLFNGAQINGRLRTITAAEQQQLTK